MELEAKVLKKIKIKNYYETPNKHSFSINK